MSKLGIILGVFVVSLVGCTGSDNSTVSSGATSNTGISSSAGSSSSVSTIFSSSSISAMSSSSSVASAANGLALYIEHCEDCHGSRGQGANFKAINSVCDDTNCQDHTVLTSYLAEQMPLGTPGDCDAECSAAIASFMLAGFQRDDNPASGGVAFQCDTAIVPATAAWARLSKTQYVNSLTAVISELTNSESQGQAVVEGLWQQLENLPEEIRPKVDADLHGTYRRLNQTVTQQHVEAWYTIAVQAGQELVAPARLAQVVPCFQQAELNTCLEQTINRAGRLILRRTVTAEDRAFYQGFYRDTEFTTAGFAEVFTALLNSPDFLYHIYHGQTDADTTALTSQELGNRLAYQLWDSPLDPQLRGLADSGDLLTAEIYQQEVERLLIDTRAQQSTQNFLREWLKLENLEPLDAFNHNADFMTFAQSIAPDYQTHIDMMNEVLGIFDFGVWTQNWDIADALSTQLIWPHSPVLADIYDTEVSAVPMLAPAMNRPGIFTRPAFLATPGINTRPIMKGVFLRHHILCDDIPAPPDNATDDLPPLDPALSTRERVEAITERPDTSCAFCHETLINGLGFATENFDALGRFRSDEPIIENDGSILAIANIDLSATPQVIAGDFTATETTDQVMQLIAESGKVEACMARHYFRYSYGRFESKTQDACILEPMRTALTNGSIVDLIRHTVQSDAFKQRTYISASSNFSEE